MLVNDVYNVLRTLYTSFTIKSRVNLALEYKSCTIGIKLWILSSAQSIRIPPRIT